jgi:hypothetical protein
MNKEENKKEKEIKGKMNAIKKE